MRREIANPIARASIGDRSRRHRKELVDADRKAYADFSTRREAFFVRRDRFEQLFR